MAGIYQSNERTVNAQAKMFRELADFIESRGVEFVRMDGEQITVRHHGYLIDVDFFFDPVKALSEVLR